MNSDIVTDFDSPKTEFIDFCKEVCPDVPLPSELENVVETYPFRISKYLKERFSSLSHSIQKQVWPTVAELEKTILTQDPFGEEEQSPIPFLIHRYADRVLILATDECAMYCRFCLRKRRVGKKGAIGADEFQAIINYIANRPNVREVIFSGGDPLMISDDVLDKMLQKIRQISHVKIIRFHTRMLMATPARITPELGTMLKKYAPVYLICHFNVPEEITAESQKAISLLADAGIILGNQSVLLRGINDSPLILSSLWRTLAELRVRPYYLHHPDPIAGTAHFRLSVRKGLAIYRAAEKISGLCVPRYVLDMPSGHGKVALHEGLIVDENKDEVGLLLPDGTLFRYPDGDCT